MHLDDQERTRSLILVATTNACSPVEERRFSSLP